ncbi:MAG TPA: c-type cytochrome, partial [Lacunisphaera sp.]|nr:c-type cytochrome [Lacunisphaera sp.]
DPQGNLWVAEMSGFNSEIGKGLPGLVTEETSQWMTGKIVKLEDTDGDGRMDRRTVFLDDLKAPRAVAVLRDGVLLADPPYVWFARDTDGDGKADTKEKVAEGYGSAWDQEASANGLLWGRDNWLHNVSHHTDFRRHRGQWETAPITVRGQFGLTQDDFGRLFFNRNSDQLRADLFAPRYSSRNPHATDFPWINYRVATDQTVWPGHPTPGVNRGYREGFLREDGSLREYTAACSPLVYRGANFPASFYGSVFVCEPAANFVGHNLLSEDRGIVTARRASPDSEFVTSTDERFRPVALANTPQGDLYIADMYRGILEEFHLITTFLREQIERRELAKPMFGLGRIWRVRYVGGPVEEQKPALDQATSAQVAEALTNPNGWWRDTAQQVLVERGDRAAVAPLSRLAAESSDERTRVAALWTLDGLEALTLEQAATALKDPSPRVRAAAVQLHEKWLRGAEGEKYLATLAPLARDPASDITVQLALSLGEVGTTAGFDLLRELALVSDSHPFMPKAIVNGLSGRELPFLRKLEAGFDRAADQPALSNLIMELASSVVRQGETARVNELLALAGNGSNWPEWAQVAVVTGLESLTRPAVRRTMAAGKIISAKALDPLVAATNPKVAARASKLAASLAKLETQQAETARAAVILTKEEVLRYNDGKTAYALCAACHQPSGMGLPGLAPALVDSPWVSGKPGPLVRILLHGKEGTPGYPGAMPPLGSLPDEQLAAVLTYIRNSWGLQVGAVNASEVAAVRKATADRTSAWNDAQLSAAKASEP